MKMRWLVPAALILAAWALVVGIGGIPVGDEPGTDPTPTAALAGIDTTRGIKCFAARQVVFVLKTTSVSACSLLTYQLSNDDVNWRASATDSTGTTTNGIGLGRELNGGPVSVSLISYDGSAVHARNVIQYRYARLIITYKAAGGVLPAGANVKAYPIYDPGVAEYAAVTY